ncbi:MULTISPECIES: flavoprotein [Paenibacillus]|jgi:multimeric flavodoxin WrbA|uniref:flavoprotein n=2 Tax=Paenibacillus TaxID=44249 RepID=UPI0004F5F465|nr:MULTISPECIES: flavoprotein [unclassified Paenibacillus]AIQ32234.1 flavoprotein [Paenibacillus sp. FSL P4-0081]OMF21023.1 flavoprotein [Paenibacillus sp. FSL H8-0259]
MRTIVHDLQEQEFAGWAEGGQGELTVISDNGTIRQCMGCFGCWTRTPGACVIRDGYNHLGELFSKSDELIIISKCMYGSYSPFVLNVLNRSISYVLPYFVTKNGETHHRNRYDHQFNLSVHFYGDDITEAEKDTARTLVAANSLNLYSAGNHVYFHDSLHSIKEAIQ